MKQKKSRITNLKKLLCFFLITVFVLLSLETVTRAYLISPSQIDTWGFNLGGFGDLAPNKNFVSLEASNFPYRVITNSFGFRSDYEIEKEKTDDTLRVLTVGDSFTFGVYVHNHQTYPARLEYFLEKNHENVEVLNAGVPGYTLVDEIEYLKEKGLLLDPDIVIIGIFENDVSDYSPSRRAIFSRRVQKKKVEKWGSFYQLAKKSAVVTYFEKILRQKRIQQMKEEYNGETQKQIFPIGKNNTFLEIYQKDLNRLFALLEQKKTEAIFLLFPAYYQLEHEEYFPQEEIKKMIGNQYPVVDLRPVFKSHPKPESLYLLPTNAHLSAYGNEVAAREVAKEIEKLF